MKNTTYSKSQKLFASKERDVGLEPSLLGEKIPGAKMVSMGPTVMGVHSTKERIKIVNVDIFYNVLKDLLKNIEKLR